LVGFDYNPEQQERMEEEAEISSQCNRKAVVLAITADSVEQMAFILSLLLGCEGSSSVRG
jgi:hypothetical protein